MTRPLLFIVFFFQLSCFESLAQKPAFKVIAFYTAKSDLAHISFVHEAHHWFTEMGKRYGFSYDSTNQWENLNESYLKNYQVVLFLDTRPEKEDQRKAFQQYMEKGGGFVGFHFAGFALTPSDFPENWDWYHNFLLGVGQYKSNTWRPVSANLRVEKTNHPAVKNLPLLFRSAPCEWYRWEFDIRKNANIEILLSVDPSSFPLGTGPKQHEIWHEGYYPIAWTHKGFKMVYMNMGHNDMDYAGGTNKTLSSTFNSLPQNQFIIDALFYAAGQKNPPVLKEDSKLSISDPPTQTK